MTLRLTGILTSVVFGLGLAGCQMDPALMGTTPVAQTAAPLNDPAHYAAVVDDGLQVPAIPVEKVPAAYQREIVP